MLARDSHRVAAEYPGQPYSGIRILPRRKMFLTFMPTASAHLRVRQDPLSNLFEEKLQRAYVQQPVTTRSTRGHQNAAIRQSPGRNYVMSRGLELKPKP